MQQSNVVIQFQQLLILIKFMNQLKLCTVVLCSYPAGSLLRTLFIMAKL